MQINPFAIERFYEKWEFRAELMLSSSDCETTALADLLALEPDAQERLFGLRLGYTEVQLQQALLYVGLQRDQLRERDRLAVAAREHQLGDELPALVVALDLEGGDAHGR